MGLSVHETAKDLFERQLSAEQGRLPQRDRARVNSLITIDEIKKVLTTVGYSKGVDFYEAVSREIEAIWGRPLDYDNLNQKK